MRLLQKCLFASGWKGQRTTHKGCRLQRMQVLQRAKSICSRSRSGCLSCLATCMIMIVLIPVLYKSSCCSRFTDFMGRRDSMIMWSVWCLTNSRVSTSNWCNNVQKSIQKNWAVSPLLMCAIWDFKITKSLNTNCDFTSSPASQPHLFLQQFLTWRRETYTEPLLQ